MSGLLWRATWRHLLHQPWQSLLAILGVAVGVAAVVATDLASISALESFQQATATLFGRATHHLVAHPGEVPETLYPRLKVELGVEHAAPVVEGPVLVAPHGGGEPLGVRLLGLDPLAEGPFRGFIPAVGAPGAGGAGIAPGVGRLIATPGAAWVTPETARELGVGAGERLWLRIGGEERSLWIAGLLEPPEPVQREALRGVAVVDLATAQELLGREGWLSRIDLRLPEGVAGAGWEARLRGILPPSVQLLPVAGRVGALVGLTASYRANLRAMGLLALVVGLFILLNAMTFFMVRRRREVGLLRAAGVGRGEILGRLVGDALLLGIPGTGLGLILGVGLAEGLLGSVSRAIGDLYFPVGNPGLAWDPALLAKGGLVGVAGVVAAALPPALEAVLVPPGVALHSRSSATGGGPGSGRAARPGLVVLAMGGGLALWPGGSITLGFVALFAVIVGYALLVPAVAGRLLGWVRPGLERHLGVRGGMAATGVARGLGRSGVAVAALVVAVATVVGMGILIHSFRVTLVEWLGHYLRSDIYVSTRQVHPGELRNPLDPGVVERLLAVPGVGRVGYVRRVNLERPGERTSVVIYDIPRERFAGFRLRAGEREAAWEAFHEGEGILVSEPLAYHRGLALGDRVTLPTARGERTFPIVGIYVDFGSDAGEVAMSVTTFRRHWREVGMASMGIEVTPGERVGAVVERLRGTLRDMEVEGVRVRSNRELTAATLEIFDRTFAVTRVLQGIAVVVALVGVFTALMALEWERGREWATLRALGLTPGEVRGLALVEAGLLGGMAGLLALPLGVVQGWLLLVVINRRSFGWLVEWHPDPVLPALALLIALPTALLAGLYPAWRVGRLAPARWLREE